MTYNTIDNDVTMAGGAEGALLANRYRIVRQLGQGGMGSVWLAEDTQLDNKPFAIKMLPSILVSNKRAYNQLKSEALVAMKLVHPNIVQIRAFEENNGNPFLVMDYIDGQTLDDYLAEKGKLSEDESITLLKPVAAALDYAHDKGIVHRDVKPGNVMIAKDGTPYVLDFGISREIQETMTRVTGKLSSGTLLYMSPEQLNGEPPKSAQDVYSFAAMVYECLKGEPPFSRGQIEHQILNNMPPPLAGASVSLSCSIMSGLAKEPDDRPPTCAAVLDGNVSRRVAEPCRKEGGQQVGGTGGSPIHGGLWKLIAALVVIALAVCCGLWWHQNEKEAARRHELDRIAEQKAEEERKARLAEEAEAAARKSATEIRIEAVIQKDKVDRIKGVDGFKVRKDALSDIFARADALFDEKVRRWSEAAVQFTNYVDECNALIRLDGERKAATAAHMKAEESKKEAEKADAGEYSTVRWSEAVKLLDSANVEFGQMRFASAVETFASAESQFNACAKYAVIERRHRAEEAAAKAKTEQERNRAEAEAKELAEQKARECERRAKGSVSVKLNEIESSVTDYPSCVNEGFVDISDKFIGDEKEQVSVCEYGNFVLRFEYVHVDDFFRWHRH